VSALGPPLPIRTAGRPALEVADIFRAHGEAYREHHALSPLERKVMQSIEVCRTAVLGGHVEVCDTCDHAVPSYNSCRDRHCPKCQSLAQGQWIEGRMKRVLPTHCFHVVFTLPHELQGLARQNQRLLYDLLFDAASETLLEFGQSRLEAQIGVTAVLHTWSRDLKFHPHLHCIVTGGGLDVDNHRWMPVPRNFLFPVRAMSTVFRGKFLAALQRVWDAGSLALEGPLSSLSEPRTFGDLKNRLYGKAWVVYAKQTFGGPQQVFNYLGQYTHRVGISNWRLVSMDEHGVCFRTRGAKTVTVSPDEFIRRFLLHVLPPRFVKIRHYGLMASGNATTRLEEARTLIVATHKAPAPAPPVIERKLDWREQLERLTGIDAARCPRCHTGALRPHSLDRWQQRQRTEALAAAAGDTS